MMENASCVPSGDQTGPKQLSLGISFITVTFPLGTGILRITFGVERDARAVRRNFGQCACGNFFRVFAIEIGNENILAAFIRNFPLRRIAERGSAKQTKMESVSGFIGAAYGALTDGKRAFLIRRFKFSPSTDIRQIESSFSPAGLLRKRMLLLSIQTPSQPKSFFGVSLVAVCDSRSNDHNAGNGPSQSLRPDSSPMSMLKSNRLPSGDTSMRPSPLMSPFGTILSIFHCARTAPSRPS